MKNIVIDRKKIFFGILAVLILLIASFSIFTLLSSRFSLASLEDVWDGVTVATQFSAGNGSSDNPYVIKSPEEFIYFKNLIEGDSSFEYQDKYYVLDADLDFGNNAISSIGVNDEKIFKGNFDGHGHRILNINNSSSKIEDTLYYGLFAKTVNATVKNLIIENFNIIPEETTEKVVIGSLVGDSSIYSENVTQDNLSFYSNISIKRFNIDLVNVKSLESVIGGFIGKTSSNTLVNNIFLNGVIKDNGLDVSKVIYNSFSDTSSIVCDVTGGEYLYKEILEGCKNNNNYILTDGKFYLDNEEVLASDVLNLFNENSGSYYWDFDSVSLVFKEREKVVNNDSTSKAFAFSIARSADIALHDSGVVGDTIYINDLESDFNYYQGLNYTDYRDTRKLPTGVNRNLYNTSNLVKVYMMYDGADVNDRSVIGNVSLTEQVSKFVYYKYYPVKDGYVEIELIDNPYADRPNDKYFQGWATDYPGAYISYNSTEYVRVVRIPVSSDIINITFNAVWGDGKTHLLSENNAWNTVYSELDGVSMQPIGRDVLTYTPALNTLYIRRNVNRYANYPAGALDINGNRITGQCRTNNCYCFVSNGTSDYDEDTSYYSLTDTGMEVTDVSVTNQLVDVIPLGNIVAGYYRAVNLRNGASLNGYYDEGGVLHTSGTCSSGAGCTYYQLMQYYDDTGNYNVSSGNEIFYRLVTRDTNIVVADVAPARSNFTNTVPLTLTGINNGTSYTATYNLSGYYIKANADLRIEYLRINANSSNDSITSQSDIPNNANATNIIYGNWQNLKIGRGVIHSTGYFNAAAVIAGGNSVPTSSTANPAKYRCIVESGYYNYGSNGNLYLRNGGTAYLDGIMTWGSDYDRIVDSDTEKLDVTYSTSGTWYGNVNSGSNGIALHTIVKSGRFGSSRANYSTGIYVGGRKSGPKNAASEILVEGGWIYNIIGGPLTNTNRTTVNDTYIDMKGGEADFIFGGAGQTTTYGNRIISVTGGKVNYSIFGGSNGVTGGNGDGQINGSSFIYVGGNAVIGDPDLVANNSLDFGAEAGSIFGIGNGKAGSTSIGSMKSSNIIIDGNATVRRNVYGGGNYGYTGYSGTTSSDITVLGGNVIGSIYGGGNNNGSGTTSIRSTINISQLGGEVGNIYGGSRTTGTIYGSTNISVLNGVVNGDVYGGGEGGYTNTRAPGTYVRDNVVVTIGDDSDSNVKINGNVYGGSAYGTVNSVNQTTNTSTSTTSVTVNGGVITGSVFGGAKGSGTFTPRVVGDITVNINGGSISRVFGGMDAAGMPSQDDVVYLNGGVIGDAFGGGNNANQNKTDIRLQGSTVTNVFGGSNLLGTVTNSNVLFTSGKVANIYGGNNEAGLTVNANVKVNGVTRDNITGDIYGGGNKALATTSVLEIDDSIVNDVYGGGSEAGLDSSTVNLNNVTANNVFGGSNVSGNVNTSNVLVTNGVITNLFGGNNQGGETATTNVEVNSGTIDNVYGGGNATKSGTSNVIINDGTIINLFGAGNGGYDLSGNAYPAGVTESNVHVLGGTITDVYGGSNLTGDIGQSNIEITAKKPINIDVVYGGNNQGGSTDATNIVANSGTIGVIYGGGNAALVGETKVTAKAISVTDIYGGGNAAGVLRDTFVDIDNTNISGNVFGGGNQGVVDGSTDVYVTNANILKNVYAGGNGATAIVSKDSSITIDGATVIGSLGAKAPNEGCVFGSGNAAATGYENAGGSSATVNIVGATVYGNVYGGPKMSTVYGITETNIGTSSVVKKNLTEDGIRIYGTVFGGGESNADGSDDYDWSFISVTEGISVNINGEGYIGNNHDFMINGSIFGSGNASSSTGDSVVSIKDLGSKDKPNKSVSIQRANKLTIDNSVLELSGTTDRTNEYSDIKYSLNIVDLMVIKNNTTLLLQHNANLLKELYSGVDKNGELVPAEVLIDTDRNTITKNVDNRIYMIPNQNLNVTINQAATAYGIVTGMSFFGMYNSYSNGTYRFGLYDDSVKSGDAGNAGMVIPGGSYVLGLHSINHDITKDGFYSNYLDDAYTTVSTDYIDPSPVGETGYRWIIGLAAVNYNFTLTASKYSSLGTYELQMIDFADGDTTFDVIGFNTEGLTSGVSLVDSDTVPRIGKTEEDANKILGLSMKTETQEWTGYNTTKLLSENNGQISGAKQYRTDIRKLPPSLMFYLYHAKNISLEGELGTVVVMLQAAIPVNQIDFKIQLITITIDIVARKYEDVDSYDASITYDRRYEMPSSTSVNITNQSQFTSYYSLITWNEKFENVYGKNNSNYHVLTTNNPLPVGTMITMIDYGISDVKPEYYYYEITEDIYNESLRQLQQYNEITYRISNFIRMGSTSSDNTYDDKRANLRYYDDEIGIADEEFIFIFDMKDSTRTGDYLNNSMLFELRNNDDRAVYAVLGIRQGLMMYSTYGSSNAQLIQNISDVDPYLYYNIPDEIGYATEIKYDQTQNRQSVIDTNYESSSMGLNVSLYDQNGDAVSSSLLTGTSIKIDNKDYFADGDGVFRIKLAGKVSNLLKTISLITNSDLPSGQYTLRFTLFASDDGLHNSLVQNSVYEDFVINVVDSDDAIVVNSDEHEYIVDGETSMNLNKKKINTYKVKYNSELINPNLRVEISKRDVSSVDSIQFNSVAFNSLFTNSLSVVSGNEMLLDMNGAKEKDFEFNLADNLKSGTYKIEFKLYDNNQIIDDDVKYVIVKKKSTE